MRVILVHNTFRLIGGAEVFFHEVGRVLSQNGHEVAYFSAEDEANPPAPWDRYLVKPVNHLTGNRIKGIIGFGKMVYSREAKQKFRSLIQDFKPDIVHVFGLHVRLSPSLLDVCGSAGVPVVMSCNDFKHLCPSYKMFHHGRLCEDCRGGRFYHSTLNRCNKDSYIYSVAGTIEGYIHNFLNIYRKNVHTFLFASEFMARKTAEFWGEDFNWSILRNPFNVGAHFYHGEYDDYLLYFGRLIDEKGVDMLIRAMKDTPEARAKIVGDGPMEEMLKAMVRDLRLTNIEFVGPKWGSELNSILSRARFVVVPSIWHENFPYVILQSFAAGKAVIGSDRGGIPELVRHGKRGLIYPALDYLSLANSIKTLWGNPSRAVMMGRASKEWVDLEFNEKIFYQSLMDIYREAIG